MKKEAPRAPRPQDQHVPHRPVHDTLRYPGATAREAAARCQVAAERPVSADVLLCVRTAAHPHHHERREDHPSGEFPV